jgi:glycosyltransferase involved in cell wall biosynthesis
MPTGTGPGVLVITPEPLGARMAGPAIRALELARALARDGRSGQVTIATLASCTRSDDGLRSVEATDAGTLRSLVSEVGSVVIQGDVLGRHPWLAAAGTPLVVDAYDPFHLEQLEQARELGEPRRRAVVRDCVRSLNEQLARADFVLCASPRQRALWLGHLAALGRINPLTYDLGPDLSGLLAVVPFGTPAAAVMRRDRRRLRELLPDLTDDDVVLVWGGGIYAWFDPGTLLRAVARLVRDVPRLRLLFLGTAHPVPGVRTAASAARDLATELGLTPGTVCFAEGWVPYDERDGWLAAADIGVSTHHEHVETEFSFRTRVVDYLWAGLPVVSTGGDELAERVTAAGAGATVPAGDVEALIEALRPLAEDAERRATMGRRAAELGAELAWSRVAAPLAEFCAAPRRAPDLALGAADRALVGVGRARTPALSVWTRVAAAVREGGPRLVLRRLGARFGRPAG